MRVIQLLCMALMWLLMMVFSWAYVDQHIKQSNHDRFSKIKDESYDHHWPLRSKTELVEPFQGQWAVTQQGLQALTDQPTLSLTMNQRLIDPALHGHLLVGGGQHWPDGGFFRLEMSDQLNQQYHDTGELPLAMLNQPINLNQLGWQLMLPGAHSNPEQPLKWAQLPIMDGLVLRFYPPADSPIVLQGLTVLQTSQSAPSEFVLHPCKSLSAWWDSACWLTNQAQHQSQQIQRQGLSHMLGLRQMPVSPVLWLLLAALLMVGAVMAWARQHPILKRVQLGAVVGLVPLGIGLLHLSWGMAIGIYLQWLVIAAAVGLFWLHRQHFLKPEQAGWPVLIGGFMGAVIMWFYSDEPSLEFLRELPLYFFWACWQQLVLGPIMSEYLNRQLSLGPGLTAVLVGVLFSVVHAPNHTLMMATLLGGVLWSYSWLRYRNVYVNAMTHALLALTFYQFMPTQWLGSARIGHFFL